MKAFVQNARNAKNKCNLYRESGFYPIVKLLSYLPQKLFSPGFSETTKQNKPRGFLFLFSFDYLAFWSDS